MFIQEFYSNIHAIDTFVPQFTTVFRGTHIVVTPELIFKVLHVLRWIIRITLVMSVSLLSLEMSWPHYFVRMPCCAKVP